MFIKRTISSKVLEFSRQYPVVAITGPRQSGKTTLVKQLFPNHLYVTMEDLDFKAKVQSDPRGFLATHGNEHGLIIDEAQEVPELFSYIQGIVDREKKDGFFILTGSQNFLLYEKITQSLAGRVALFTLLPLSIQELKQAGLESSLAEEQMQKGFYPRTYEKEINDLSFFYMTYVATYVERDVRNVLQISNLVAFQKFMKLCAARIGNIINFAELARDCDIDQKTAKAWLSVLEASYIIKLIYPFYNNFSKRLIKSPKLYFIDIGLACHLLGIKSAKDLFIHEYRGSLFESMIMMELSKTYFNQAMIPPLYFWRTAQGQEIDCIIEKSYAVQIPVEIKASVTMKKNFAAGIEQWPVITGKPVEASYVVYAGNQFFGGNGAHFIPWKDIEKMDLF